MSKKIGKKKLIKILKGEWPKTVPTQYQDLADCIRSDQVPASDASSSSVNDVLACGRRTAD